jgi:polysaccharide export outer membrane protein
LSLPLVGDLHAEGMTVPQLRDDLTKRLTRFIRNPVVTVTVKEPRSHSYNILGQVMHPGSYVIERPTRVLDAIAKAGGFQDFAKEDDVYVLRRVPGGPQVKVFFQYHKVIQGLRTYENVQLQKGDVIVVP